MDKTWALWKSTFLEAHKVLQRYILACGGANQFRRMNASSMAANTSRTPAIVTPEIINKMDDYMDNMANFVTSDKAILQQLMATNNKKSSTITTQATTILALSYEVRKSQLRITKQRGKRW